MVKSWPNVASNQLQSRKIIQPKYRVLAWKAKYFLSYLTQEGKIFVTTSHSMVRQDSIEI